MSEVGAFDRACDGVGRKGAHVVEVGHARLVREQAKRVDYLRRELPGEVLQGYVCVLNDVVKECGAGGCLVVHLLGEVVGVEHVGRPALVHLVGVRLVGDVQGSVRERRVDHGDASLWPSGATISLRPRGGHVSARANEEAAC